MRATGIIRRVDDLGRVVAPIEQTESIPMSDYFNTHEENYTRQELMDIVRFEQLAKKYNFSVSISDN